MDSTAEKATAGATPGLAQRLWQETETKFGNAVTATRAEGAAIGAQLDYVVHNPAAAATATLHGLEIVGTAVVVAIVAKEGGAKLIEAAPKVIEAAPKVFQAARNLPAFLAESLKIGEFGPRLAFEGAYNETALSAIGRQSKSTGYLGQMGNKLLGVLKPAATESNEPMMMATNGNLGGGGFDRTVRARELLNQIGEKVREYTHQSDGTTVQVASKSGNVGIRFPDGAVRQVATRTPVDRVDVAETANGIKQYFFNGSRKANLLIDSKNRYSEAGLHNGDLQFVMDTPGGGLKFTHSDNAITTISPGKMEVQMPGGKILAAKLPAISDHVQITEHADGAKSFQLAQKGQQDYSMRLRIEAARSAQAEPPRPAQPERPPISSTSIGQRHAVKPGAGAGSFAPVRNNPFVPPATGESNLAANAGARPVAPPSGRTPFPPNAGRTPFAPTGRSPFPPGGPPRSPFDPDEFNTPSGRPSPEAGFVSRHVPEYGQVRTVASDEDVVNDRYPAWRLGIPHSPDRIIGNELTGIDPRAHINMNSPTEVTVGQMELPWFLEDAFNGLGRH